MNAERAGRTGQRRSLGTGRDRALLRTLVGGGSAQLAVVASQLVTLPFVARSLHAEGFGVYATLTSLIVLLGFADLGIGSSLITRLALVHGDDRRRRTRLIASGAASAAMMAVPLAVLVGTAAWLVPWQRALGASSVPEAELERSVLVASVVAGSAVVGTVGHKALYAMQRGGSANVWLIAGSVIGAGGTITVATLVEAPVWAFLLTGPGVSAALALGCLAWLLSGWRSPAARVRWCDVEWREVVTIAVGSGWFAVIGVAAALAYQSDTLIVAATLGAGTAGVYGVAVRLFSVVRNAVSPAMLQLWPAFAEAISTGDVAWVRHRLPRVVLSTACVVGLSTLGLAFVAPSVVSVWLSPDVVGPHSLYLLMALWVTYGLAIGPYFYVLNAAGLVRTHALLTCLVAIVSVPVSVTLAHRMGIGGPIIGSLVVHVVCAGVPAVYLAHRFLRGVEDGHAPVGSEEDLSWRG